MRQMHHLWRLFVALPIVWALGACGGPYQFHGTVLDPPNRAPNFVLADQDGATFQLQDQRGKIVLLYFGFTSCPDICPTTLADLAATRQRLGDDAKQIQVVLITVDPERDTQQRLKRYVSLFDTSFIGLRGTQEQMAPIMKDYGVSATKRPLPDSALGYTVDHSAFVYVIDQAGMWREQFAHGAAIDDMTNDLRYLIKNGAS